MLQKKASAFGLDFGERKYARYLRLRPATTTFLAAKKKVSDGRPANGVSPAGGGARRNMLRNHADAALLSLPWLNDGTPQLGQCWSLARRGPHASRRAPSPSSLAHQPVITELTLPSPFLNS